MTTPPSSRLTAHIPRTSVFDAERLKEDFAPRDALASIPTAILCWFLTIIFSVSLAALIFRGPLAPYLPLGIGISLATAVAVGLVTTLTSSIPGCIAIPSDRTAPMLAILAGTIAAGFSAGDPAMLPTCLAAILFATAFNGMALWLLGRFRLGILVRFLPYPVVGGFMAGAGWLLVKGAFTVATGVEPSLMTLPQFFERMTILHWAPSLTVALALLFASRRSRHFLVIPTIVALSVACCYGTAWFCGVSLNEMREIGWLPSASTAISWHPISLSVLTDANWGNVAGHLGAFLTIIMVSAISLLMISSSVELIARIEVDADRELQAAGLANFAALLTGGMVGFHSLSLTCLSLRIGPNSRWVGLFSAALTALTLFCVPQIVWYLPIPLLSALLLYLGLNFLTEWLFDSFSRVRRTDYFIIVLILIVVAWAGYLIGVGVGLIMALTLFALRYSLINVVRLELNGTQHRSNVDRTPAELAVLRTLRPSIHILKLQGFIFFGTAYSLLQRVRTRAHAHDASQLRYLILDFRHVTGVDSSALLSLAKLLHIGQQVDFTILCSGVPASVLPTLKRDAIINEGFSFHVDVDHAVEWCEERELAGLSLPHEPTAVPLEKVFAEALPDRPELAAELSRRFVQESITMGHILATQGDRTRDLFLIQSGRISALLNAQNGDVIRLRTMGPGSVVGEIGMYLDRPRTASLIAETDSVVWRLSLEALTAMERDEPRCAAALHHVLARMLASRLIQANELLEISLR